VGVVDDKEFPCAEQFIADHEGPDGIVAGSPARIANYVRITFGQAGIFGGIQPGIHAGKNRKAAGRGQSQFASVPEVSGICAVGRKNFRKDLTHLELPQSINLANRSLHHDSHDFSTRAYVN
jgi:hypothetical protein